MCRALNVQDREQKGRSILVWGLSLVCKLVQTTSGLACTLIGERRIQTYSGLGGKLIEECRSIRVQGSLRFSPGVSCFRDLVHAVHRYVPNAKEQEQTVSLGLFRSWL